MVAENGECAIGKTIWRKRRLSIIIPAGSKPRKPTQSIVSGHELSFPSRIMAKISAAQFVDYAQRSQIVRKEDLQASLEILRAAHHGKIPADVEAVAEHLIKCGMLTSWQSDKIKEGKYRGFFLGKYKLLGHLGSGGMSTVYLAEHTKMHRRVAIKVLPRGRVDDSSYLERFYREAQAAAALDHPNIVRAYDIDSDSSGLHYLVMEFVPGKDLKKVAAAENQPLDAELVVHYISQAAAGLQHAHAAGLVHRDVKPANLLVDADHQLKLLDLGLALTHTDHRSLTEAHEQKVFGTADYLAPEQALDSHNVDARVDIYALGCTMYYALVGHAPFPKGTLAQRIAQHQSSEPEPLTKLRPDCPPSLAGYCQQMMRKVPAERYQTAGEVHSLLVRWLSERRSQWSGEYRSNSLLTASEDNSTDPRRNPDSTRSHRRIANAPTILIAEADSRVARHRQRSRKKKKEKRFVSQANSNSATDPTPVPIDPTGHPLASDPSEVSVLTNTDERPLLAARRERVGRAKKPPIGLWIFLLAMVLLAVALAFVAVNSGAL